MKAKLVIEGKEFDIEINDPKLQELVVPEKQTGYERVAKGEGYYINDYYADKAFKKTEQNLLANDQRYESANYYSDEKVAKANARADKLMRQLRRFAVEHRKEELDWNEDTHKYFICFYRGEFRTNYIFGSQYPGTVYFDSKKIAELAINTFYDELIWYFTEYKDSL